MQSIFLPESFAPAQIVRVVVTDDGTPKAIAIGDLILKTEHQRCARFGLGASWELCAIAFPPKDKPHWQETLRVVDRDAWYEGQCVPADPIGAWSRGAPMEVALWMKGTRFVAPLYPAVLQEGPVRVVFGGDVRLAGCNVHWEATAYHGLQLVDFEIEIANSDVDEPRGHLNFERFTFTGPKGSTVIATDLQPVGGFEPRDGAWERGTGEVDLVLTPKGETNTLLDASEWACRFMLVPSVHAAHEGVAAIAKRPGFSVAVAPPCGPDGVAVTQFDFESQSAPTLWKGVNLAKKQIQTFIAERRAGAVHSGAFPSGPSTRGRGSDGNHLRHPLGQPYGGPTGSLAADPQSYLVHTFAIDDLALFLSAQEDALFDRARISLERDGAPYRPKKGERFTLQPNMPGEPFGTKGVDPEGWWEAALGAPAVHPPTHANHDDQHYRCLTGASDRNARLFNSRRSKRRLEKMAYAGMAHVGDPMDGLRAPGRGTRHGRGLGWVMNVVIRHVEFSGGEPYALDFLKRCVECLAIGQLPCGAFRVDDWSKEFTDDSQGYGRWTIAKNTGVPVSSVTGLKGTQPYQEAILHGSLEECKAIGIDVSRTMLEQHFLFVWTGCVIEDARAPFYRVIFEGPVEECTIAPASTNTADFNAQTMFAYALRHNYFMVRPILKRWCFDVDPLSWLGNSDPKNLGNRAALLLQLVAERKKEKGLVV